MCLGIFYLGISLFTLAIMIITVYFSYRQEQKYFLLKNKGGK